MLDTNVWIILEIKLIHTTMQTLTIELWNDNLKIEKLNLEKLFTLLTKMNNVL